MSRGRAIWLVARRELLERGRSRAFLFSLILSVGIIVAGLFLPGLIGGSSGVQHLGIVGSPPASVSNGLAATAKLAGMVVRTEPVADLAAGEARLRDGSLDAVLVIPADGSLPTYVVKSRGNQLLQQIVASSFSTPPQISFRELEPADPNRDTSFLFANVGVILLFISIFTFGTWVLTGVVEEKQSRVVEVVLSTIEPRDLLVGKVLGIGLLGLVQLVVMVGVGLTAGVLGGRFSLPPTTGPALVLLVVWFILGYALYSTALGVLGALASRMEEASNASSPVSFIAMGAYFFSLIVAINDPAGTAARVASFIPPVSPMVVPLRAALGAIEPWEMVGSALVTMAAIWLLFVVGGRVYSGAVLQTGGRIRLRDAWRASGQ
ncbi:MAG TPA: ABC transporter permease [Candidatus Limnocylindrales bacterium]|nr:ABC transporter permease [Candidatus Limnocylindrales bacterium]